MKNNKLEKQIKDDLFNQNHLRIFKLFIIACILLNILPSQSSYGQKNINRAKSYESAYEFSKAIDLYEKELKNIDKLNYYQKRDLFLGLGSCFMNVNDYEQAKEYFLMCLETDLNTKETYYKIGMSFLGLCDYSNAMKAFQLAIDAKSVNPVTPTCKNFQYDFDVNSDAYKRIEMAKKANNRENLIPNMVISNMRQFNSEYSEFGVLYKNGILFFSSMKKNAFSTKTDQRTLQGLSNIYTTTFTKTIELKGETKSKSKYPTVDNSTHHSWTTPTALPTPFNNNKYNDGTLAVDFENNIAFVMQCNGKNGDCNIVSIEFSDNFSNSNSQKINLCNDSYNIGHPCLSTDGNTLYFVSDMPGGYGGTDIWMSRKQTSGLWSTPENLGANINSGCDEMLPTLYADSLLIFSSSGHQGYGGLDLFYAYLDKNGSFEKANNFGLPLNSGADDFSMIYASEFKGGFFCSNRPGGMGSDDIYFYSGIPFRLNLTGSVKNYYTGEPIKDAYVVVSVQNGQSDTLFSNSEGTFDIQVLPGQTYIFDVYKDGYSQNFKTIHLKEEDFDNIFKLLPDREYVTEFALIPGHTGLMIEGLVTEAENQTPIQGQPMIIVGQDGYFDHTLTDETGLYRFSDLNDNNSYTLMLAGKGYWTRTKVLDIPKMNRPRTFSSSTGYNLDFEAVVIPTDEEIIIYNIYYEFDKADLLQSSFSELDKIAKLLKENPNLTVEISAHTDERGSDTYNLNLSQKRAQSVVNYLTSKGINKKRLVAKGYGKTTPIIINAQTEEEHQINRRTSFKVLNISDHDINLIIESVSHNLPKNNTGNIVYSSSETASVNNSYIARNTSGSDTRISYKVQIAASRKPINNDQQFKNALTLIPGLSIVEEKHDDGWYRYFAGVFNYMNEAVELREQLKKIGYSDCFISVHNK